MGSTEIQGAEMCVVADKALAHHPEIACLTLPGKQIKNRTNNKQYLSFILFFHTGYALHHDDKDEHGR